MTETRQTWGGKRPGAGRKPILLPCPKCRAKIASAKLVAHIRQCVGPPQWGSWTDYA